MYLLLTGELPFNGITEEQIKNKILRGRYCFYNRLFKDISSEAKDLIRQCFIYDPNQRISSKEALNHPFFKNEIMENLYINLDPEIENKTKEAILSLINFSYESKFFQAVITYLVHNFIPKEEENKLKNVFLSIDSDFDGKISRNDLRRMLKKFEINISNEEFQKIIERVDFDNDGYIGFPEFLQATVNLNNLFTEENLKIAFNSFDIHSDGTVSVLELEEILGFNDKTNRNVIFEFMKEINKTETDEFTFEEFKIIVMKFLYNKK
jgi:calcium-dependent protein kinase